MLLASERLTLATAWLVAVLTFALVLFRLCLGLLFETVAVFLLLLCDGCDTSLLFALFLDCCFSIPLFLLLDIKIPHKVSSDQ